MKTRDNLHRIVAQTERLNPNATVVIRLKANRDTIDEIREVTERPDVRPMGRIGRVLIELECDPAEHDGDITVCEPGRGAA